MSQQHLPPPALAAALLAARQQPCQVAIPRYLHAPEPRELLAPPAERSELTLEESRLTIGDDFDDDCY